MKTRILENRWYTQSGKAKPIEKDVEPFREWAKENKQNFLSRNVIKLVVSIGNKYPELGLAEATNLMVYLVGCYSNAAQYGFSHSNGSLFTSDRYDLGKEIAANLVEKPFDIRRLELVK